MTESQHALVVDFLVAGAPMQRQRYRCALDVRNPPEKSMTFYMHIGKTGGTSIRRAIEATSALKMMPVYGDDPQFIDAPQFAQLSEFALNDVDLVYGHFGYGLHATARRPYRYVTMLRDPYQLARSLYFFKKYVHRDEYFRSFATVEAALENFPAMATDNPICRALAGRAAAGPVTAEDFEQAKANMVRDFAVVGVMEHFDDSVAMLSDYLGVTLEARFENQTPATPESRALDMKSFRRAARPVLEHDIALYNFALETFWGGSLA